jgi:hypothetical protein
MDSKDLDTNLQQYVDLRTILDSVNIGSLRFYLNATSHAEQDANFKYLRTKLMEINDHIWKRKSDTDCPDGYVECNGCCVPYNCVIGGNLQDPR